MKYHRSGWIALCVAMLAPQLATAQTLKQYTTVSAAAGATIGYSTAGAGAASLYNYDIYNNKVYMGGWHTTADQQAKDDVLYSASYPTTSLTPTKLVISNYSAWKPPYGPFHLNDPSVVAPPDGSGNLIMFSTCLDDGYGVQQPGQPPVYTGWINYYNNVCMLLSSDQGATWNLYGDAVYQGNNAVGNGTLGGAAGTPIPSLNNLGAWSPGAIVMGNKIWVYYNTNQPVGSEETPPTTSLMTPVILVSEFPGPFNSTMTTLDNPFDTVSLYTTPAIFHPTTGTPTYLYATNPRVFKDPNNNNYIMSAQNTSGSLAGYTSVDGLNWYPLLSKNPDGTSNNDGTLVNFNNVSPNGNANVQIPHLYPTATAGQYTLYYTTPWNNAFGSVSTTQGTEQCVSGYEQISSNYCSFYGYVTLTLH